MRFCGAVAGLVFLFVVPAISAEEQAELISFFEKHCYECHDDAVSEADLNLLDLPFAPEENKQQFAIWERVYDRIHSGEMPPKRKPRPDEGARKSLLTEMKKVLVKVDRSDIEHRGRVVSRRLTREEYENTLHDLLGIDLPLADVLPDDGELHGFSNVADGQQLSHHRLARYLDVADIALDHAFSRALKGDETYRKEHSPEDLAKRSPGNYRGPELRGGESVSWPIRLQFYGRVPVTSVPRDGWYRVTVRDVRAVNPGKDGVVWGTLRSGKCYSDAPQLYLFGLIEAAKVPRTLTFEGWIEEDHLLELKPNDFTLRNAPTGARGGNVSYKGRDLQKDGFEGIAHRGITVERIYPNGTRQEVRRHLFGEATPEDAKNKPKEATTRLVERFARRAFRRPVTGEQLAAYYDIAQTALEEGDPVHEALRSAYRAILCSPRFLTLIETPGALDDHAVASRLSYALWQSMPDWTLVKLANEGKLRNPDVMGEQIERMLSDPKAERFVERFTDQWLDLDQIDFTAPDPRQFRSFDPVVQASLVEETREYFRDLVRNDRPVTRFIDSNHVWINGRLARHYRLDGAKVKPGEGLQKVMLPEKARAGRGGFITQGAILKVTADGTSTSPVVRGVFVNERILGRHLPTPPPGVPAIEPDIRGATSIRDQLIKHRESESCYSCHLTIDPPGMVLENFDPVGGWRTLYGAGQKGVPIDPSGVTVQGEPFAGIVEWKAIYTDKADALAYGFARQFLTYGTGASPRFSDKAELEAIAERAGEEGYGVRSILKASLASDIFLTK